MVASGLKTWGFTTEMCSTLSIVLLSAPLGGCKVALNYCPSPLFDGGAAVFELLLLCIPEKK